MKKFLIALLVIYGVWWIFLRDSPAAAPPVGIRLAETPEQTDTYVPAWSAEDHNIRPLARYRIKARVLAKKRYFLDPSSDLAPYDLALGWGDMSDSAILSHISVSQSGRWYEYTYDASCPIPRSAIARQSANVHCLPADSTVRHDLGRLRVNAFTELSGFLVEVQKNGVPNSWKSSLVRDDEGAGACEVFWITDVVQSAP